jgi:hypothetical protein
VAIGHLGDRRQVDGVVHVTAATPGEAADVPSAGGHPDRGGAVEGGEAMPAGEAGDGPR